MKNLLLAGLACLIIFSFISCSKSTDPVPVVTVQDSMPKIASLYLALVHSKAVEYFTYNKQSRLIGIRGYNYDTSTGTPVIDSFLVSLTLDASPNPPATYDEKLYSHGAPPAGSSSHHILFYDAQSRVTIDSITVSDKNLFTVGHYLYDDLGNTTAQRLNGDPLIPDSYHVNEIDTMNIQNENLITIFHIPAPATTSICITAAILLT